MNATMNAQGKNELPTRTGFLQHPDVLQNKIRDEMLHLKKNKQKKKKLNIYIRQMLLPLVSVDSTQSYYTLEAIDSLN